MIKFSGQRLQKVGRSQEQRLRRIAQMAGFGLLALFLLQFFVVFVNRNRIANPAPQSLSSEQLATIETIVATLRVVPVYVVLSGESLYPVDYGVLGTSSNKSKFYPFFYKFEDGQSFSKEFIKDGNTKLVKSDLGFIYREYRKNGQNFDYVLFKRDKTGKLISQNFTQIPVYYAKNSKNNIPFYLQKDGMVVAIPYFLSQNGLAEVVKAQGKDWELVERNLLAIVNLVPSHEFGQYIQIIPPD